MVSISRFSLMLIFVYMVTVSFCFGGVEEFEPAGVAGWCGNVAKVRSYLATDLFIGSVCSEVDCAAAAAGADAALNLSVDCV